MLFFGMPGNENLAHELSKLTASKAGRIEARRFPDGESYIRIRGEPKDHETYLVCSLADPDSQVLPLIFAARTIRTMGARSLTLIAPYLSYLRQDAEFHKGEAVSSRIFADLIGGEFDSLITVDPHLHRYQSLDEIYSKPTQVIQTHGLIGTWVREHVRSPFVLGPDAESVQWVEEIAAIAGCPWATFTKDRRGDRSVKLMKPAGMRRDLTPVLMDDIISSGATMIGAARILAAEEFPTPYCIAVHGLFDESTSRELAAVTRAVLTTDTVPHPSNHFRIAPLIAGQLMKA
jgi:ribose-phosphate pyrophosphokinase